MVSVQMEISSLAGYVQSEGLSLIPLSPPCCVLHQRKTSLSAIFLAQLMNDYKL